MYVIESTGKLPPAPSPITTERGRNANEKPTPSGTVRHDCLEALGLSVTEAAQKLGVSRKQLSDVVNGRSGVSPEMAIRLDKAFGGGAGTWCRLQAAWDQAGDGRCWSRTHPNTPLLSAPLSD